MKSPFKGRATSFAGPPADTPYRRAQQEWDRRMGAAVLSARAWRAMALAGLALAGCMAGALTIVALQKRTFVHVVEVAPEGRVMSIRVAGDAWRPTTAQIAFHLGRFVQLTRSLPTDGVVLRQNWLEAYKFLTPKAASQLTEIARADDPFLALGRAGRTVHIRSIIQRSDNSWEVSWIERETTAAGSPDSTPYSGVFSVAVRPPQTAEEIAANPLGLLISDFSWSRVR